MKKLNIFYVFTISSFVLFGLVSYFLFFPKVYAAGAVTVQVSGTTNTQAVLSYTAPDNNACTVEVSENSSMSPLVHDVDPTLFSGSNMDSRVEAITGGAKRIFVVGKRVVEKGIDGNNYSRALQAYTTHYYNITCGSSVATGSFTTANIPINMTYQDIPQVDPTSPGNTIKVTLPASQATPIIDPHTGTLIRQISLNDDHNSGTAPYSGAFHRLCGNNLIGPANGYLCSFITGNISVLYYIIPSTGVSRYLGFNNWGAANTFINPNNSKFYTIDSTDTVHEKTYTGDFVSSTPTFGDKVVITDVWTKVQIFNPLFIKSDWNCAQNSQVGIVAHGDYAYLRCSRQGSDSMSWMVVIKISTGSVIAAVRPDDNIKCRWCGVHNFNPLLDIGVLYINTHEQSFYSTQAGDLPKGATTITIDGPPTCASGCTGDPRVAPWRVGDKIRYVGWEVVTITAINSPTSLEVTPLTVAHPSGTKIYAVCEYPAIYWDFINDPLGVDTTNTNFIKDAYWGLGGHDDVGQDIRLTGIYWEFVLGDLRTKISTPVTRLLNNPPFAGKTAQCFPNGCDGHPAVGPPGASWFGDYVLWSGAYADTPTVTNISGQLYRYQHSSAYPSAQIKHYPTAGTIGGPWMGGPYNLLDISGPGSVLGTGASDSYKHCTANATNECTAGSVKGQEFINVPDPKYLCCKNNFNVYANAIVQVATNGSGVRVVSQGLTGLRETDDYPSAHSLYDGSWMLFHYQPKGLARDRMLMAKLTPFADPDNVDRTTFIRAPVAITVPQGQGIASASVDFGYTEQGTVPQYYCTSRMETCTVVSATVLDSNPFNFKITDSYSPAPCTSSCTITIPVLPMHIAYYQVRYYDASGKFISNGDQGVATESAVSSMSGANTLPPPIIPAPTPTPVPTPTPTPTPTPATDITAPIISNIISSNLTTSTVTITWDTNESSDTQVEFGTTVSYGSSSVLSSSLGINHTVNLVNLLAGTTYHYKVKSRDASGNLAVSLDQLFTTTALPVVATPPPTSYGWFNQSWLYRKKITIDRSKVGNVSATSLTNFPVLVSITDQDLKQSAKSDGGDIVFTGSDGTTKFDFEIESYDPSTGQLTAWVKIPSLSSSVDTNLYLYFGNSVSSNLQNPTGVWDSSYKGVWHMSNSLVFSSTDSTGKNSLVNNASVSGDIGQIAGSASFNGSTQHLSLSSAPVSTNGITLSAWVKETGPGEVFSIAQKDPGADKNGWSITSSAGTVSAKAYGNNIAAASSISGNSGVWQYIVGTFISDSNRVAYLNSVAGAPNSTAIYRGAAPNDMEIGALKHGNPVDSFFKGSIDEVRVSNTIRSDDWIKTEYNNQSSPSTFLSIGSIENIPVSTPPPVTPSGTPGGTGSSSGNPAPPVAVPLPIPTPIPVVVPATPSVQIPINKLTSTNISYLIPITSILARGTGNNGQIRSLQTTLYLLDYLTEDSITGYFGSLTETAVKKYQCDRQVICSGTPETTGYGNAGPSTRSKFNIDISVLTAGKVQTPMYVPQTPVQTNTETPATFYRNLSVGMKGDDVRKLQVYLNSHGFTISILGPGSVGNETTYFGVATQKALIKFQVSKNIKPASGYFGTITRRYIK